MTGGGIEAQVASVAAGEREIGEDWGCADRVPSVVAAGFVSEPLRRAMGEASAVAKARNSAVPLADKNIGSGAGNRSECDFGPISLCFENFAAHRAVRDG